MPTPTIDLMKDDADMTMHSHEAGDITGLTTYTDEMAQDAVGNSVGNGLDYDDATGVVSVDETELAHNSLGSKQGGTSGQYYHLTSAQATVVGNTSGTNSGDVTLGTNPATALSLSGQQLSLADKFVQIAGDTMTAPLVVDGSTNAVQLTVQANGTQTANLQEWQEPGGYPYAFVSQNYGFHGLYAEIGGSIPGWMDTSFYVNKGVSSTVYNSYAASLTYSIYNPGGAITSYGSGISLSFNVNNSGNAVNGEIYGADFTVTNYNDAVLQSSVGGLFRVWNGDTTNATMNKMTGGLFQIKVQDSTVTDIFGIKTDMSIDTGTVTNAYGVYLPSLTLGSGSLTNNYGIYVEAVSVGTNKYALYTNAGDVRLMASGTDKMGLWGATPVVQPTTSVGTATFTANSGTAVNDASTFDGYTLKQVVKALRGIGILA